MSNVKIVPAAYISGRPYKTAKMATAAFVQELLYRQVDRRDKKIRLLGIDDDTEWWERHMKGMKLVHYGAIAMLEGQSDKERKAYRRALPIFQRYLP
jgi:hypothetical protein